VPIAEGLLCAECGCVTLDPRGWVGKGAFGDDDDVATPTAAMYCPPCAAGKFGYRTDVTDTYECVWPAFPEDVSLS